MAQKIKTHSRLRLIVAPILVVVTVFLFYMVKPDNIQVSDAKWAPHVAMSIIYDRDLYLDEYHHWIERSNFWAIIEQDGKILSFFPMGGSALAVPQMILMDAIFSRFTQTSLREYLITYSPTDPLILKLHLVNASFMVALSAGVIFLIAREYLNIPFALILTATYAFGTTAYSTASRAMWQHGPSMLMLSIALLLLTRARKRPNLVMIAGLPIALAFIVRPTNSITVVVITLYVLICYKRRLIGYLLSALLPAVPFILINLNIYGEVLPPYFGSERLRSPFITEALLGNLISPARGLFIFSPVLLLVPLGVGIKALKRQWTALDWAIILIIGLHWLVISLYDHWWAGHSFGPRFFSDILPYLVYFLIPVLYQIQSPDRPVNTRIILGGIYGILMCLSIVIHYRGATAIATSRWNSVPQDVDKHPERLWDWGDLQFMRGLGNDLIAVTPTQLIVETGTETNAQPHTFQIGRMSDGPIDITMLLPGRAALSESSAPAFDSAYLPGGGQVAKFLGSLDNLGMRDIGLEVDSANVVESSSLDAVQLVARMTAEDGEVIEETHVIALQTGPDQDGAAVRPGDIQTECRTFAPGELYALFGAGWHDEETTDYASWRWASSPAFLYVWSDDKQDITIEVMISALHDSETSDGLGDEGMFYVTLPNDSTTILTGQSTQPLRFDTPLQPGWNTVTLELEAGNFRPADLIPGHYELRELSFSIDDITLTGACATSAAHP